MASASSPLIPVGIDLGSLHARVAIGEPIEKRSGKAGGNSTTNLPNVIANAQGSRYTVALAVQEQHAEGESTPSGSNPTSSFVFGEAARRHLTRDKKKIDQFLVRYLCTHPNNETENHFDASSSFFAHLAELACHASTSTSVQPSQLRIVISMPPNASEEMKLGITEALENGVRQLLREKEGKKMEKKMANQIVVGVVSDAAATCLAYGLLDNNKDTSSLKPIECSKPASEGEVDNAKTNSLVIDWGSSGLTLTHLEQTKTHLTTQKTFTEPKCAGTYIVSSLLSHCASLLERKHSSMIERGSVLKHARAVSKLTTACETAVKTLARTNIAQIAVDGLYEGLDLNCSLSKPRFEMLCGSVLRLAEKTLVEFMDSVGKKFDVVLIGGNVCQMPAAEALIKKLFADDVLLRANKVGGMKIEVDESVAIGCAKCAQQYLFGEREREPPSESNLDSSTSTILEEKKEMEIEVPLSPVGIGIALSLSDNLVHTLIDVESPLPAHASRVIKLESNEVSSLFIYQIDSSGSNKKIVAEINEIAAETEEIELTLELSTNGKLSMAVNGGDTIIV